MEKLLLLAAAGGLGSLSRYGLSGLVHRLYDGTFPLGTFVVNSVGCLLFGLLWGLTEYRLNISPQTRAVVFTGFMGAFTTFSSFAFESGTLIRAGQWGYAFANIIGQNALGLACLFVGFMVAKAL